MDIHNNSVLHYLYTMVIGLVIYSKARAFKANTKSSRPRPDNRKAKVKPRNLALNVICNGFSQN